MVAHKMAGVFIFDRRGSANSRSMRVRLGGPSNLSSSSRRQAVLLAFCLHISSRSNHISGTKRESKSPTSRFWTSA